MTGGEDGGEGKAEGEERYQEFGSDRHLITQISDGRGRVRTREGRGVGWQSRSDSLNLFVACS